MGDGSGRGRPDMSDRGRGGGGSWGGAIGRVAVVLSAGYLAALLVGLSANLETNDVRPLGPAGDWQELTGFGPVAWQPPSWDVNPSASLEFVGAAPSEGAPPSRLRSLPFDRPEVFVVYYRLVITAPQPFMAPRDVQSMARVYLECVPTGERVPLPIAETNDRLAETVATRSDFCEGGQVSLVAEAEYPALLAVSTPHGAQPGFVRPRGVPAHLYRHAVLFGALGLIGMASALVVRRALPRERGTGLGHASALIGVAAASYGAFFVYAASPTAGRAYSVLVVLGSAAVIAWTALRARPTVAVVGREMRTGMALWFLGSLFFVTLLFASDTGAGPWHANSRYFPAIWSSDNNLPMATSEALYRGDDLVGLLGGRWRVSDRGPLQAGTGALLRPLALMLEPGGIDGQRLAAFHHITGVVLNSMWLLALADLARTMGWTRRRTEAVAAFAALSPIAVFNSTYVWPKMAAAALAIAGACRVLPIRPDIGHRLRPAGLDWIFAAALTALALLAHASVMFFLLAVALWLLIKGPRPNRRQAAAGLLVGATLLAPWVAWQRIVDPPGNALIKSALAGTYGFEDPEKSVLATVIDAYREIGFGGWWDLRADSVAQVTTSYWSAPRLDGDLLDEARVTQQIGVTPSLTFTLIAVALVSVLRRGAPGDQFNRSRHLMLLGVGGVVVNIVVFWGPQTNVTVSLASLLMVMYGGMVAMVETQRRTAAIIGVASAGLCAVVWLYDPLTTALAVNSAAVLIVGLIWALGVARIVRVT